MVYRMGLPLDVQVDYIDHHNGFVRRLLELTENKRLGSISQRISRSVEIIQITRILQQQVLPICDLLQRTKLMSFDELRHPYSPTNSDPCISQLPVHRMTRSCALSVAAFACNLQPWCSTVARMSSC